MGNHLRIFLLVLQATSAFTNIVTSLELRKLGAACRNLDSCILRLTNNSTGKHACSCKPDCPDYRTCCSDAPLIFKRPAHQTSCTSTGTTRAYFMVDRCSTTNNKMPDYVKKVCEDDYYASDVRTTAPITSLKTKMTYKNFFCFRCNEDTTDFLPWTIRMKPTDGSDPDQMRDGNAKFDVSSKAWYVAGTGVNQTIPVTLSFQPHEGLSGWLKDCFPIAISKCSRSATKDVAKKCGMYVSYVSVVEGNRTRLYRNPHCAACNGENLANMQCGLQAEIESYFAQEEDDPRVRLLYPNLVDVNLNFQG